MFPGPGRTSSHQISPYRGALQCVRSSWPWQFFHRTEPSVHHPERKCRDPSPPTHWLAASGVVFAFGRWQLRLRLVPRVRRRRLRSVKILLQHMRRDTFASVALDQLIGTWALGRRYLRLIIRRSDINPRPV
ncbi:hypothetical protein K466DRAFT_270556 [Polyporus arcularius HHB13444]|uniref:Uncharacterized protein n=1 Tax=Polyporus arcularius HHB13444 TaxID=1314778 RepID=A0A5C3PRB6_9APHY|nr:hypothetical protein K466DRAFT_270556 [Polyporus arcularius HHB13444]